MNEKRIDNITRMRPVVVWPEISSPAQSLASVTNVPSNSSFCCLGGLGRFCCFKSLWLYSGEGSFRQQMMESARHKRTMSRPARKVKMLESRKHHHLRSLRHSISSVLRTKPSSSSDILASVCWWSTRWWWFGCPSCWLRNSTLEGCLCNTWKNKWWKLLLFQL